MDEKKRVEEEESLARDKIEIPLAPPATPPQQDVLQDESNSKRPVVITPNIKLCQSGSPFCTPLQTMSPALLNEKYTPDTDPFLTNISPSLVQFTHPNQRLTFSNSPANSANVMTLPPDAKVPTRPTPLTMPGLEMETQERIRLELRIKKDTKKRKLDDI